jgi:hypothetical protein
LKDIDGCSQEEIEDAFTIESIFQPKCMDRRKLKHYVQTIRGIELCTIGNVQHATSIAKGGTKKVKRTKKQTRRKRLV